MKSRIVAYSACLGGLTLLAASPAWAIPAFSRQTGEECSACHVGGFGPQLTQHGRIFKLEGYGAASGGMAQSKDALRLISAMAVANYTHTAKPMSEPPADHFSDNNNTALQEASLFVAGRVAPGLGVFVQGTYSGVDRKTSLDNVDIRYAHAAKLGGKDALFGVSVNNNPTVQDPWNTTPAWSFPYTSSDLAPGRPVQPLIADGLGQQVVGATGYLWLDDRFYAEVGGYRPASKNLLKTFNLTQDTILSGTAPYGRLVYSRSAHGQTWSVGAFALDAKVRPDPLEPATDHYRDLGLDASYQRLLPKKAVLSLNASYTHENRTLGATYDAGEATNRKGSLNSINLDASYYWDRRYGATVGLFDTTGSRDDTLFTPEPDAGSLTGRPNTNGFMFQADWTPFGQENSWMAPNVNLRLGVQYVAYSKFNGGRRNYDGFDRAASDNNTLSVFLWTAF